MARARDPARDKAKEMYLHSEGKMLLKDIAAELGKSDSQIRKWKNQDGWDDELNGNVTNGANGNVTNKKPPNKQIKKVVIEEEPEQNKADGLTDKQRQFCINYVRTHNATQAAIMAGYAKPSAYSMGSQLLRNIKVVNEIKRLKTPMIEATFVEANDFIQLLVKIAFADIGDFVEGGGYDVSLRPVDEIDTSVLSELSNTENGIKIKMENKMKAIELLAKYSNILQPNEREQLAIEQARVNIDKAKAELAKIENPETNTQESEIAKMLRRMAGDEE
ncbi:terminase small subunit [Solibacillus sp. FSL H8-0523]|uniref:terminase small subunit n=1 Tax=Solibacillus sp. FSL H8-0523 TaxID=2954511 RepID=UPI003101490E